MINLIEINDYPKTWMEQVAQLLERLDFLRAAKEKDFKLLQEDFVHQERMINRTLAQLLAVIGLTDLELTCKFKTPEKKIPLLESPKEVVKTELTEIKQQEGLFDKEPEVGFFKIERKPVPLFKRHAEANIIEGVPYGKVSVNTKYTVSVRLEKLLWHKTESICVSLLQILTDQFDKAAVGGILKAIGRRVATMYFYRHGEYTEKVTSSAFLKNITGYAYVYSVDEFNEWLDSFLCGIIFRNGIYNYSACDKEARVIYENAREYYGTHKRNRSLKDVPHFSLLSEL
jgi:hypothetical protein